MMRNTQIRGFVTLERNQTGFPAGGLTVPTVRVELIDPDIPDEAWISELTNLGDIPWFEGETRMVDIRIVTEKFRAHVLEKSPKLHVRYGPQFIGTLELEC